MKKFEYKTLGVGTTAGVVSIDKVTDTLNRYGENGWELIAINKIKGQGLIYVFKREIESSESDHKLFKTPAKAVDDESLNKLNIMSSKFKFSSTSLERLVTCHDDLVRVMHLSLFRSAVDFGIAQGHRTIKEQQYLYEQGRTRPGSILTYIDGVNRKSNHNYNPSLAVDIYAWIGRASWDVKHLCYLAGVIMSCADELCIKLRWGGNFDMDGEIGEQNFTDMPHFELIN